ncbi:MAG: hypothetical protein ACM3JI_05060, partial [Anaerolineae bacterium]
NSWPSLIKKKRMPELSVEEVVSKYQGFEGELVCFFEIKENISEIKKMIDECLKLKELGNCFILHVISSPDVMPSSLNDQAIKLGYDVGVCEEEKTIYSSIFHEVIFGYFDELIAYKELLNENFLFPDKSLAEKYVRLHNELSAQGKGIEDYEEMIIYEVWKHKG